MARSPSNSFLLHADGIKWLIALSAAGLGGSATLLDKVQAQSDIVKWLFVTTVFVLAASVLLGGVYYFRLIAAANAHEVALRKWVAAGNSSLQFDPDNDIDVTKAKAVYRSVYPWASGAFSLGLLMIVLGLSLAAFQGAKPEERQVENKDNAVVPPPADHFSLFSTEARSPRGLHHTHTFLLNDAEGQLWQMICEKDGRVRFVKVPVEAAPAKAP
jgi:hypothetical protein